MLNHFLNCFFKTELDDVEDSDEAARYEKSEDEIDHEEGEEERDSASKPKYFTLFGYNSFCLCKEPKVLGDVAESDVSDYLEKMSKDAAVPSSDKKMKRKAFRQNLRKLIKPFFRKNQLSCSCTRNRAVVR